jgi:hypothetical protein
MPPPGWYPDPELAWTWRWWDGGRWTDLRAPQSSPPERDPYSSSTWFEESVQAVRAAVRRAGVVVLVVWLAVGALSVVPLVVLARSRDGREIRSLLDLDSLSGPRGGSAAVELTQEEFDRLGELAVELAWAALPWLAALAAVTGVASLWTIALVARVADRVRPRADRLDTVDAVGRGEDAADALRRVPAALAAALVLASIALLAVVSAFLPLLLALVLGGGGGAIAVPAVFGVVAAGVALLFLWVRLSLAPVIAALGGHGIGIRRSWNLTEGHFWAVTGRLVILVLVAGAVSAPLSVVNWLAPLAGLVPYLVVVVLVQAVTSAAGTLLAVPAQVVLVRHLTERNAPRLGAR